MTTIARALVTIKRSKNLFIEALRDSVFSGVIRNGVEISTGLKTKEFSEKSHTALQSINDRLDTEFKLRCQINRANFETKIKIGDQEMSINDALTYRTHILPNLRALHQRLVKDLSASRSSFSTLEREFDAKFSKASSDDELKTLLEKRERPSIFDIQQQIDVLKEKIDFFDLEFDAILTENNPIITIG